VGGDGDRNSADDEVPSDNGSSYQKYERAKNKALGGFPHQGYFHALT
jgi:hypothetical protein